MRFGKLRVRNFRSYQDATVDFATLAQACVSGDNGAGKSSLVVDAPLWALFGRAHLDLDSVVGPFGDTAAVDLVVDLNGEKLLVTRTRKKGRDTGLSVRRKSADGWDPVVAGAKEAQAFIDEHIMHGRGYRELVASVYMVQGQHSTFTKATQAEAKEIFASLLAVDNWLGRAERVAPKRREAADKLAHATAARDALPMYDDSGNQRIVDIENELPDLEKRVKELRDTAVNVQRRIDEAEQNNLTLDELEQEVLSLARRRQALHDEIAGYRERLGDAADSDEDLDAMGKTVDELREAKDVYDRWKMRYDQLSAAVKDDEENRLPAARQALIEKQALLDTYDADVPVCDRCGQDLRDEAALAKAKEAVEHDTDEARLELERVEGSYESDKAKLDELGEAPPYKDGALAKAELALKAAQGRVQDRAFLRAALGKLDDLDVEEKRLRTATERAPKRVDVSHEKSTLALHNEGLREAVDQERTIRDELAQLQLLKRQGEEARARRKELDEEVKLLESAVSMYSTAEYAFGRDGIPAYLIDAALPQVEATANELLELMSAGALTLRLATQRETKTVGIKDALDILVSDGVSERAFSTFSGGEAFRINFALRVALAEMVARRSGLDMSMLVVDEPEGLDASGRSALIQALGVIEPRFDTIVLVSHHEDLREALPQQVIVRSGTSGSTVTITQ